MVESFDEEDAANSDLKVKISILDLDSDPEAIFDLWIKTFRTKRLNQYSPLCCGILHLA
jgi:hypothetical protein